jgi:hypothetical protein
MLTIISESIAIGFITWVIGTIIFNLSINKMNKDKHKPYGIDLAFFTTGLFIYLLLEKRIFNNLFTK